MPAIIYLPILSNTSCVMEFWHTAKAWCINDDKKINIGSHFCELSNLHFKSAKVKDIKCT